jgi:hypothetical protein
MSVFWRRRRNFLVKQVCRAENPRDGNRQRRTTSRLTARRLPRDYLGENYLSEQQQMDKIRETCRGDT